MIRGFLFGFLGRWRSIEIGRGFLEKVFREESVCSCWVFGVFGMFKRLC